MATAVPDPPARRSRFGGARPSSRPKQSGALRRGKSALQVAVVDERGRPFAARGLAAWLRRVAPVRARGSVSIALVSDMCVRALNRKYRDKDYATDVLSFPANSPPRRTQGTSPVPSVVASFLGDIVIARSPANRRAPETG